MRGNQILVLLRGVNVGGQHPVPMPELRRVFAGLGCDHIDTYLQSGNVVCNAHPSLTATTVQAELTGHFGFPIPVVMRTGAELDACVAASPFAHAGADALHVVFFEAAPPGALVKVLEGKRLGQEKIEAVGRELFLYLPHGFGRSRLALGCTAPGVSGNPTVRNWKTVLELQRMLRG